MSISNIHDYLKPGCRAHLVGIGGVSMSPLAEVLLGQGLVVTGSDMNENAHVVHLRSLGIDVTIGHLPETVARVGAQCIIRTAAVHDDNPEIAAAIKAGIPVFERAQAWGLLMQGYPNALCVAGTHGKTTTTSMCTHIAMAARRDPTVMIGGTLPLLGAGHRVGHGDTIILESCEYCNSFHSFSPTVAVILNVEADHLDFFKDLEDVEHSFRVFAERVPENGTVIINSEDENSLTALDGLNRKVVTFGVRTGDVRAADLRWEKGLPSFTVVWNEKPFASVSLQVPGLHNVKNALAAAASAIVLGFPAKAVEEGLAAFRGAGRRFEYQGSFHGADIYDDYAHHPSEVGALLDAVKELGYKRIICAFQPHTYSRTKALFDDFVKVLSLPDITLLTDIYAAREQNTIGISSKDLADRIEGAEYLPSLSDTENRLRQLAQPGDLILTVGAGDICTVGYQLVK